MDGKFSSIYVDLDSIFDTRLATLHLFGLSYVQDALSHGYFERLADEFPGIDAQAFSEAYRQRNLYTLRNAVITPVVVLIKQFAKQTAIAHATSPFRKFPKVVLNTYPYNPDDLFCMSVIKGLVAATDKSCDIEIINMAPKELTPEYVKKNFAEMIMYDYQPWLDIHAENGEFGKVRCPEVMLIAPALVKSNEAVKKLVTTEIDAFEMLQEYTAPYVKLVLHPVSIFSVDMKQMKKTAQKTDEKP